jgi:hypothetical protein
VIDGASENQCKALMKWVMMIQLSIYCSCCRILRCVALRMQASERASERASIRRRWRCQFGVPNPVPAVAKRIRTLDFLRPGFWHFWFFGGWAGESWPIMSSPQALFWFFHF